MVGPPQDLFFRPVKPHGKIVRLNAAMPSLPWQNVVAASPISRWGLRHRGYQMRLRHPTGKKYPVPDNAKRVWGLATLVIAVAAFGLMVF